MIGVLCAQSGNTSRSTCFRKSREMEYLQATGTTFRLMSAPSPFRPT